LEKKEKPVAVQAPQVILHKTRTILVHVNDGKALQKQINQIDSRVTVLEKNLPRTNIAKREIDVPDHLYKSYHALKAIGGKGTAQDVCTRSGRARAAESSQLNILVTLGFAIKYQSGRNVIFQLTNMDV
jgi:hypothetical protein